jgi:hypothetical protein
MSTTPSPAPPAASAARAYAHLRTADAAAAGETPPERLARWSAANAARVELLVTLAREALDTWEPDLALPLLQAAERANGNVDARLSPLDPFDLGPVERRLYERIVQVVDEALRLFREEDTYSDMATYSTPAHFRELAMEIERLCAHRAAP